MNRLLVVVVAVAAGSMGACSNAQQARPTSGTATIEVPTPPAEGRRTSGDRPLPATADRAANRAPTGTAEGTEPIPEATGRAVVDVTTPTRGAGLARTINPSANWRNQTVIELRLGKPGMSNAEYLTSEAPTVSEGKLKRHTVTKDFVVLEIDVSGNNPVYASVAAHCAHGTQHIDIAIGNPNGLLRPGTTPLVWLSDMQ